MAALVPEAGHQRRTFTGPIESTNVHQTSTSCLPYIRENVGGGIVSVHEVRKLTRGQHWFQETVRPIGPEDPAFGAKGPVNVEEERARRRRGRDHHA